MEQSDQDINRGVRGVLARHWVDLTKTNFLSRPGILRMRGEMRRLGAEASSPIQPQVQDTLDQELKRVNGVRTVQYALANWRRGEEGEWHPVGKRKSRRGGKESEGDSSEPDEKTSDDDR